MYNFIMITLKIDMVTIRDYYSQTLIVWFMKLKLKIGSIMMIQTN